jgi:hypothetical protein
MLFDPPVPVDDEMDPAHVPLKSAVDASLDEPLVDGLVELSPHAAKQTSAARITAFIVSPPGPSARS